MSDKASLSHIERVVYVSADTRPGDSISYSQLDRSGGRETPCTIIEPTECGDYSGNALVGESNYRVLKAEFPWLVEIYGSHGYKALAYLGRRENQSDALIEAIDSLTDYPVYSDDDHSALEMERESEEWESHGARDFREALQDIFDLNDRRSRNTDEPCDICEDNHDENGRECTLAYEHDADLISDEDLFSLWRDGCDAYNVSGGLGFSNEQGDSIHFYIAEWFRAYERNPQASYSHNKHSHRPFAERILMLAALCRVIDADPAALLVAKDAWLVDPNGDDTIKILREQIAPDYHAAVLYSFERERTEHTRALKEDSNAETA